MIAAFMAALFIFFTVLYDTKEYLWREKKKSDGDNHASAVQSVGMAL